MAVNLWRTVFAGGSKPEVSLPQGIAYSLPHLGVWFLFAPLWQVIPGIYAKYFGLSLTAIASAMLIARLFDAVIDPIIGRLSDVYRHKTGTRKPLIVIGGICYSVSGYFLFVPNANVTSIYFLGWFFAFLVAWTLFEIPHIAWGGELTLETSEKTRIYGIRLSMGYLGLLLFYVVPFLPIFKTTAVTPETLRYSAIVAGLLMLPFLFICIKWVPDGHQEVDRSAGTGKSLPPIKDRVRLIFKSLVGNKSLLIFLGILVFSETSNGMWYGLIFLYVDSYLGLGRQFAGMFLVGYAIGVIATPVWYRVSKPLGKRLTWGLATLLLVASYAYTALLKPGTTSFLDLLTLKTMNTLGLVCVGLLGPSILSDIVDYGRWKFRVNNAGLYFAVYVFVVKAIKAVAGAMGLAIAGWYGFEPKAELHSHASTYGLVLAASWVPSICVLGSLIFIMLMPINARRHAIICRRLKLNEERAVRLDRARL